MFVAVSPPIRTRLAVIKFCHPGTNFTVIQIILLSRKVSFSFLHFLSSSYLHILILMFQ